jgi:hypothetical protein
VSERPLPLFDFAAQDGDESVLADVQPRFEIPRPGAPAALSFDRRGHRDQQAGDSQEIPAVQRKDMRRSLAQFIPFGFEILWHGASLS